MSLQFRRSSSDGAAPDGPKPFPLQGRIEAAAVGILGLETAPASLAAPAARQRWREKGEPLRLANHGRQSLPLMASLGWRRLAIEAVLLWPLTPCAPLAHPAVDPDRDRLARSAVCRRRPCRQRGCWPPQAGCLITHPNWMNGAALYERSPPPLVEGLGARSLLPAAPLALAPVRQQASGLLWDAGDRAGVAILPSAGSRGLPGHPGPLDRTGGDHDQAVGS